MTGLVDRLESLGLAQRVPVPADRRVRGVIVTEEGAMVRRRLLHAVMKPPAQVREVSTEHLKALIAALDALRSLSA